MQEHRQPLDVVARSHHRHRHIRARLPYGADELASQVPDPGEHVLDLGPLSGDAFVSPLLAFTQRLVFARPALYAIAPAQYLEHFLPALGRVGLVGVDIPPSVVFVQHFFKVVAVVLAGCAGGDLADEAVLEVHAHTELVAEVALAVLAGVRGIQILLSALGFVPVRRLALGQALLVFLADVLARGWHKGGIDGLSTPGDVAMALQLGIHALEQDGGPVHTAALGEAPDGVAVGDVHGILQQAKALVAHAVQQLVLHLLIREVVQALQDQHAHHHFAGVGGPSTLAAVAPCKKTIHQRSQFGEIDVLGDGLQRVTHLVDLALARGVGEQVELQGTARADHVAVRTGVKGSGLSSGVLRGSLRACSRSQQSR